MKKFIPLFLFIITFILGYVLSESFLFNENKEEKTSGAFNALQFWTAQRAYPEKDIPNGKYFSAFQQKKTRLNKVQSQVEWKGIGPKNIGGRTLSVAIDPEDPNIIYAGSAGGGLWRSTTGGVGGSAWEYISTGYPIHGVGAIEINPENSQEIYIGTGEVYNYGNTLGGVAIRATRGSYGIGILKTTDGGATWSKALDWAYNEQGGVQALAIDPQNPEIVWAGTTEGTLRSTNSGADWELVNTTIMATDILINPIHPDTVFIACGNLGTEGNGIYRTYDAGENWEKLTNGLPEQYGGKALLDVYKTDPNIMYASIGDGYGGAGGDYTWLCKTTDGGDSWEIVSTTNYSTYQGWYSHFVVINQDNPDEILTGGIDVWKSTDGGETLIRKSDWAAWYLGQTYAGEPEGPDYYSHADHHAFAVHPDDPDIVYFGNDGGVFVTGNFGETYMGLNGGYQTTQFYGGFSVAQGDSNLAMGGLQDNGSAIYLGETSWYRVIGGDGAWTAIDEANDYLFGSWQYMNILRSNDLFETDKYISPPRTNEAFAAPYIIGHQDPTIMYAASQRIYKSTNSGDNWQQTGDGDKISNGIAVSMSSSPFSDDVVFVGYAPYEGNRAEVYRTVDGGINWENVTYDLPDRYPMDITFDYNDQMNVYVVFSGFGTSHVFKSTDLGENWVDINQDLPDVPTSAVAVHPYDSDIIYVGNDLGVYVSFDQGETWSEFTAGLPDGVFSMDLSFSTANDVMRLATHGNGIYESKLLNEPLTSVDDDKVVNNFELMQNYPNPFNPTTKIEYRIPVKGKVTLKIFDSIGQTVQILVNDYKAAGSYSVNFDGSKYSSGVYFYQLQYNDKQITKKMNLVK